MELARIDSQYYCGVDLHARSMFICIMDKSGNVLIHRNMQNNFDIFKTYVGDYIHDLAIGVETSYSYYWLADACRRAGIPFYLGHAYYMKCIHGGKKKNDRLDSKKIADLMRANHFPLAYPYPEEMRATRDLLRRRHRHVRLRAEAYGHIQKIFTQQGILHIQPIEVKRSKERRGLLAYFEDPELRLMIESDLDFIDSEDIIIQKLEQRIRANAKYHDRAAFNILLSVPGIGDMYALTILYEIQNIGRFSSHQKFCSYSRLVRYDRSSAGHKTGGGNQKIGNPYLKWAIGDIIIHAKRTSSYISLYYDRLISKTGKRKAPAMIRHKFGIAIYYMLKNSKAFDEKIFIQSMMKA
jgi:transposase